MNWQQELRGLLDTVPGGAQRLIAAIDEGRMNPSSFGVARRRWECGTAACVYGHIYGDSTEAHVAATATRHSQGRDYLGTYVEWHLSQHRDGESIRAEVVVWLAEHGESAESSPRIHRDTAVPVAV